MEEIIICAAIKIESTGKIFYGHRHNHCFKAISDELSWNMTRQQISELKKIQGFITSKNRFVNRKEALNIALMRHQIITSSYNKELYSENLY